MQTEGQQQFRFTWQLGVTIAVCLIALALPIASIVLAVHSITRGVSQPEANSPESASSSEEALENALEGIADEKLGPRSLESEVMTRELFAADIEEERKRIEELLKSVGGIAILTGESGSEIRLLARIPQDRLAEFAAACFGERTQAPLGDLVEIVIRKGKEP